jgi:hypothetical protein
MLQTLQTRVESGYTSVFSVASANLPDGSEIVLRVPSVSVTSPGIADVVTEHFSCLRFHQKPIAVIGLIKLIYRVILKSVKHFKNLQQIDYATDHGNSYADRERNSPSFFQGKTAHVVTIICR